MEDGLSIQCSVCILLLSDSTSMFASNIKHWIHAMTKNTKDYRVYRYTGIPVVQFIHVHPTIRPTLSEKHFEKQRGTA